MSDEAPPFLTRPEGFNRLSAFFSLQVFDGCIVVLSFILNVASM